MVAGEEKPTSITFVAIKSKGMRTHRLANELLIIVNVVAPHPFKNELNENTMVMSKTLELYE